MEYKDFQKAAVKKIVAGYERGEKHNRFLVADEVGLGKTIIAKGVLRCLFYFEYLKQGCSEGFTYNVLYLCSNLNIAEQNKAKLGVSKRDKVSLMKDVILGGQEFAAYSEGRAEAGAAVENRTTMLMKKLLDNVKDSSGRNNSHYQAVTVEKLREECIKIYGEAAILGREKNVAIADKLNHELRLNILPITTKTSIRIQGKGHQKEREFIRDILQELSRLTDSSDGTNQGAQDEYNQLLNSFREKLNDVCEKYPQLKIENLHGGMNLPDEMMTAPDENSRAWQKLRQQFALASVEMMKYDFVIMDEFQNFSEILHEANETKQKRKYFADKAAYIYAALSCADGQGEWIKSWLKEMFLNGQEPEISLSGDESRFWQRELVQGKAEWLEQTGSAGVSFDIGKLVTAFTACAAKRLSETDEPDVTKEATYVQKEKILSLVKAILNRDNTEVVSGSYRDISNDTEPVRFKDIEEIRTIGADNKEKIETSVTLYKNDACDENAGGLLQWWENDAFNSMYGRLRRKLNFGGRRKTQVPFRYFLNLHYATAGKETDSYLPALLLNCFIHFTEQEEEKLYLWQYAQLLLKYREEIPQLPVADYSVEKLEPLRCLLGSYVPKAGKVNIEEKCENIVLEKVFGDEYCDGKYTKILMLSATPFRMYITEEDDGSENADIVDVCDFLDTNAQTNPTNALVQYKNSLVQFARDNSQNMKAVLAAKNVFQGKMNCMFTRMERFAVLRTLVDGWFERQAQGSGQDEISCGGVNELFCYVKEAAAIVTEGSSGSVVTYAADAPYMGTFMHGGKDSASDEGYTWKREFNKRVQEGVVSSAGNVHLCITKACFERKEKPLGLWHGVYKNALDKILELGELPDTICKENHPGAARLLWVPSCISRREKLQGVFAEHKDYGKTIVFSRLVQVPRMLAGLSSYEVLRRLTWLIENYNSVYEQNNFNEVLQRLLEIYRINTDGTLSVYQLLDKLLEKTAARIKEGLLQDNNNPAGQKTVKMVCQMAMEQYYKRYCERYGKKEIENTSDEVNEKFLRLIDSFAENLIDRVLLNRQHGMFAIWASKGFWDGRNAFSENVEAVKVGFVENCVQKVLQYCEDGCLLDVLQEWLYICWESEQDLGEFLGVEASANMVECLNYIRATRLNVSLYKEEDGKLKAMEDDTAKNAEGEDRDKAKDKSTAIDIFFARCIGMSKDDDKISSVKHLQQAFNSPFAPFMFATTSMGQEGLDFHHYADRIIHWRLPSNPVDFEQREGRINRYHCLALRKKLMEWYGPQSNQENVGDKTADVYQVFEDAFHNAREQILQNNEEPIAQCGLVPDWVLLKDGECATIKRYVPYFYLSKVNEEYHKNLKVLQLYRSVIGQTNPEEVMERLMSNRTTEEVQQLFVDFSPYNV